MPEKLLRRPAGRGMGRRRNGAAVCDRRPENRRKNGVLGTYRERKNIEGTRFESSKKFDSENDWIFGSVVAISISIAIAIAIGVVYICVWRMGKVRENEIERKTNHCFFNLLIIIG